MHIDGWTLGLQTVNVLVLVWLLARYLFRPVAKIIAARQQAATALMADAANARAAALAERSQAADQAAQIAQQRGDLLAAASAEAAALKTSLESAARADADRLRLAAQADLATARQAAAAADANRASRLAIGIAAKLIDRLPQETRIAGFIEGLAAELAKLPAATRAELSPDAPVHLLAPRALKDDELAACHAALARVLGRDLPLPVTVEPALLVGLELEAPHAIVRNSFRADLAYLQSELLAHDTDHA
ncbi:ATP synthase B/B' CF family protein [Paraburkholderia xenovorans LB400]|uniref:ATP synthase subunit b n=1 Tax=Paraburkholderia xenovorans (strain LB400) TaxID=266265 RepID=Q13IW8_PARXL|nr:ATP synthase F0 subunit B [Paraburkholderia xenovorans]ABE35971.1 ATP synthase F0 subcomplex B subunit [Paraburkholderia xenovorans LB400]AIP34321.1 ATP synthase B/B' CF family protein [Paraburkholderia xenovorans LB400]